MGAGVTGWNGFDDVSLEEFEVTRNGLIYCDCGRVIPCRHCEDDEEGVMGADEGRSAGGHLLSMRGVKEPMEIVGEESVEYAIQLPDGNFDIRRGYSFDGCAYTVVYPSVARANARISELVHEASKVGAANYTPALVKRTVSRGAWEPA